MKVTIEKQAECQVLLTIEASDEEMAQAKEDAYRALAPRVAVPGFRPGKAPRNMIERQIGKERLLTEALGDLMPKLYRQALTENDLHSYDEGEVEIVQRDPLVVKVTIQLRPTVTLGDYQAVRVTKEAVAVDDSEVDDLLSRLQEEHAEWVPPDPERGVHLGDQATIDLRAVSGEETFINRQGIDVVVSEERGIIIPGLASEIIGAQMGVEKKITLSLPETFSVETLRGQPADFYVTVREVKEKHLPALDDEFAKTAGDYADLAALREHSRQAIQEGKEKEARERLEGQVLEQVVAISQAEFPPAMLLKEEEHLVERIVDRLRQQGLDMDTYLKATQKTRESLLQEMEPEARQRIRNALVLDRVAGAENIAVEPAEVDAEIESMSQEYGDQAKARKTFSGEKNRRSIQYLLRERKTLARLVEMATAEQAVSAENPAQPET